MAFQRCWYTNSWISGDVLGYILQEVRALTMTLNNASDYRANGLTNYGSPLAR